jgi:hypothetical protein
VAMATFWRTFHHLAGEGGGAHPAPFTLFTITYNVMMYSPAERAETLALFLLYPYMYSVGLKVHKNEKFFGFDFEFCTISVLGMHKK